MSKFYQPNLKQTNTRYGDMWYFHEDPTIGRSLNLYGEYSQVEIIFMQYFTNSESIVVDIGANIGTHTLGVCQTVGHVIAIEPDQYNYNLLTMNTESRENVTRMRLAISNCAGQTGTFFDFGKTKLERGDRCPLVTLDSLELPPDFIKIDVEGMELQCLQGATDTISFYRPIMLIEMQDTSKYPQVFDYLKAKNYSLWWLPVGTYHPENWKGNTEDVFGSKHGVVNWLCTPDLINTTLQPVVDRDDTMERMVYRQNNEIS